jgi:hypothetical protein
MSGELAIPSRLVQQVLQTLLAARLVVEISRADPAYAPARPLEAITCHHVLMAMRATQGQELVTRDEPAREEVYGEFARIQEAEKQASASVTMLALVNRAQARLELAPPQAGGEPARLVTALVPPAAAPPPIVEVAKGPIVAEGRKSVAGPDAAPAPASSIKEPATDDERGFPL